MTLDSAPSCSPDAEQILQVCAVGKAEAQRLLAADAGWLPELIELAVERAGLANGFANSRSG